GPPGTEVGDFHAIGPAEAATQPSSHSASGQAQHPLGDDVALDLARPPGDGARERAEVLERPGTLPPAAWTPGRGVDGLGAQGLDAGQVEPPLHLARVELQHEVLG